MTPITWWMLAQTILTAVALVLAAVAWWRCGGYVRQARAVIAAYAPLVERQADTAERMLPLLADRISEPTEELQPVDAPTAAVYPVDDPDLYGRHALSATTFTPATGDLRIPRYAFAKKAGA